MNLGKPHVLLRKAAWRFRQLINGFNKSTLRERLFGKQTKGIADATYYPLECEINH